MKFRPFRKWFSFTSFAYSPADCHSPTGWSFGFYIVPTMPEGLAFNFLLGSRHVTFSIVIGDWE
jgi:hypothetical protein